MERINIANESDLSLVVPRKGELLVSSMVLCNTSDVFRAMLGKKWAEGQALRNSQALAKIDLPADDFKTMRVMMCALHQRNDMLQDLMTPAEVELVAETADKYNCSMALQHTATRWVNDLVDDDIQQAPLSTLAAAYQFNLTKFFAGITDLLVKKHTFELREDENTADSVVRGLYGEQ